MLSYYWCQLTCIKNIIILVMFIYKAEIIKLKLKVVVLSKGVSAVVHMTGVYKQQIKTALFYASLR